MKISGLGGERAAAELNPRRVSAALVWGHHTSGTCGLKQWLSDIMPRARPAGPRGSRVSVTVVAEGTSFGSVRETLASDGYWMW